MPLPWKKAKVGRISRLVADLQSPKRGGSLVVETGFPTSLIDLFVKNRDRLKKPCKRKPKPQQIPTPDPTPPPPPPSLSDSSRDSTESLTQELEVNSSRLEEVGLVNLDCSTDVVEQQGAVPHTDRCQERSAFVVVVKSLVVVVLAMSTKRLAVGITMSAFVLLLLEYVGAARAFGFFRPCTDARKVLDSWTQKCLSIWERTRRLEDSRKASIGQEATADSCELVESLTVENFLEEIEVVESGCHMNASGQENPIMELESEFDSLDGEERLECLDKDSKIRVVEEEDNRSGEVLICKNQSNRGAKLKSKILNKFVPKKLRTSKKRRKNKEKEQDSSSESSGLLGETKLEGTREEEDRQDCDKQERNDKDESLHPPLEESYKQSCREQESEACLVSSCGIPLERKGNLGYLILLLIVLAGLVGGRVLALVATLSWCLMLGFVARMRRGSGHVLCPVAG